MNPLLVLAILNSVPFNVNMHPIIAQHTVTVIHCLYVVVENLPAQVIATELRSSSEPAICHSVEIGGREREGKREGGRDIFILNPNHTQCALQRVYKS